MVEPAGVEPAALETEESVLGSVLGGGGAGAEFSVEVWLCEVIGAVVGSATTAAEVCGAGSVVAGGGVGVTDGANCGGAAVVESLGASVVTPVEAAVVAPGALEPATGGNPITPA